LPAIRWTRSQLSTDRRIGPEIEAKRQRRSSRFGAPNDVIDIDRLRENRRRPQCAAVFFDFKIRRDRGSDDPVKPVASMVTFAKPNGTLAREDGPV
jgi:hypothetical protein